ncbi:MAG: hypothetical protein QF578_21580 [Alphaproteobacteria bacterium]|jgi:hypothetical protein|nr:hypothetical protein [Alphaproteobacteria bacterium]MDP6813567.1 hypothetical protein [Alphaproteobacteria bacterium]
MRLNLGCGFDRKPDWINVDKAPEAEPDELVDLEALPWPWPDDSVDEVLLRHVLEHLGPTAESYLAIIKELWRICRAGAEVRVVVPHPRHDHFLNDPTHVRPITVHGLEMFSQKRNREWRDKGVANTPLGLYLGVDFEVVSVDVVPDEPWRGRLQRGEIQPAQLQEAMRMYANVIMETTIVMRAVKGGG